MILLTPQNQKPIIILFLTTNINKTINIKDFKTLTKLLHRFNIQAVCIDIFFKKMTRWTLQVS